MSRESNIIHCDVFKKGQIACIIGAIVTMAVVRKSMADYGLWFLFTMCIMYLFRLLPTVLPRHIVAQAQNLKKFQKTKLNYTALPVQGINLTVWENTNC